MWWQNISDGNTHTETRKFEWTQAKKNYFKAAIAIRQIKKPPDKLEWTKFDFLIRFIDHRFAIL